MTRRERDARTALTVFETEYVDRRRELERGLLGLVHPGGDHKLIETAEALERRVYHRVGIVERIRPAHDRLALAADLANFVGDRVKPGRLR